MTNLKVEIISPNGILFSGEAHLAVVPSSAGDIGFMQGHELVIATLREGQIELYDDKQNLFKSFPVKSGFLQMKDADHLSILLDS